MSERLLMRDGDPIELGGRTLDMLIALESRPNEIVLKRDLLAQVWPDVTVEEVSLRFHIARLREALGDGVNGARYIITVPGRGYCFVAPISRSADSGGKLGTGASAFPNSGLPRMVGHADDIAADRGLMRTASGHGYQFTGDGHTQPAGSDESVVAGMVAARPTSTLPPTNLPEPLSELIGRENEIGEILNLAAAHRLVTLTGPGGIGKTSVALALARELRPNFADGVWLAEFSPLTDPGLVPATVVAAAGIELGGEISVQRVAQTLADRRLLLVLDTCEHVIGVAAALAEAILRAGPASRIIATSREPLRVEGEWIYGIPPLAVPAGNPTDDALQYGAVQLFVSRARAAEPHFVLNQRIAGTISAICRRLDGIPLAVELAAARAAALDIGELAVRLSDRFSLLTRGRRTALPRHQTLRATLDWSYELLSEPERILLRRLAIFAGPFSLEASSAVAGGPELATSEVTERLLGLIAKSLIAVGGKSAVARYWLLDTTRAYALEKLVESGERERLARRHAEFCRELFERAEAELERRPLAEWLLDYGRQIENLRAALDRAFSSDGDASLGVALATAAIPLWLHLSLLEECRARVEQALTALAGTAGGDARREMKLWAALAVTSLRYTRGAVHEIEAAWARALRLAESLGDVDYQLRSLWGLWVLQDRRALALARRFSAVAVTPADRLIGKRMTRVSYHYLGNQSQARRYIERVIADHVTFDPASRLVRFQIDQQLGAQAFLVRIQWLQGSPEQAMRTAESTVEQARAADHGVPFCHVLAMAACPIALWTGNLDLADQYIRLLCDRSTADVLPIWLAFGRMHLGALFVRQGDPQSGLRLLRTGFDELGSASTGLRVLNFRGELAAALGRAGQISEGLATVDETIDRSKRTAERWIIAELLRIKGELLRLHGAPAAADTADACFRQALDWARRQDALSWELRSATSLARLLHDQGRFDDAKALLQPVYARFTEGFETADLKAARALLDNLR